MGAVPTGRPIRLLKKSGNLKELGKMCNFMTTGQIPSAEDNHVIRFNNPKQQPIQRCGQFAALPYTEKCS